MASTEFLGPHSEDSTTDEMNTTSATLLTPTSTRPSLLRSLSSQSSITSSLKRNKPRLYLALYARGTGTGSSSSSNTYATSLTCPSYHWTYLIGPKGASRSQPGTCLQIVHTDTRSWYEEVDLSTQTPVQAQSLLLRITLAKVRDEKAVKSILRNSPASKPCSCHGHSDHSLTTSSSSTTSLAQSQPDSDADHTANTCPQTSCLSWARTAFLALFTSTLQRHRILKTYLDAECWAELEECARKYAKKKRNQGRFHNIGMGLNRGAGDGDGQAGNREWNDDDVATWNFWERRETTP